MDFNEFQRQYKLSRASLIAGDTTDINGVQTHLRHLAGDLTDTELAAATKLINGLPALIANLQEDDAKRSPEMREALRIIAEGRFDDGTVDERSAALADVRKRIWAIADRAGADSSQIRNLTRGLESDERALELGPPWSDPRPDNRGG
ncbi:hypothetical protein EV138_7406 [Kribbella voronezhensis]|uniref:Uncharacterized protein n=1 Tax=Kribbella voronezhensis TaxID=2512212 RepID=A0A4R7STC0_9ACTN|nr:hypothetical protein [Kribbella voronezhensis]TDU82512.1 hypothetical protein EV138_7406 [Kribbella voronezhensis]